MKGTVTRRFLISYPIAPDRLGPWLPPGSEPCIHDGMAWFSDCFVNIEHMRPSFAPPGTGVEFNYLIHRTKARLPFPDGKKREAVLVLEPNIDHRFLACAGGFFTGVRFHVRNIKLEEGPSGWRLTMTDGGRLRYEAEISRSSFGDNIPAGSRFRSIEEADSFLLGVSFGSEWHRDANEIHFLAETHDVWQTTTGTCRTHHHALLKSLCGGPMAPDHVITMTDVPHYFAIRSHASNNF
jgi:uncharacterized protein YqjF (DUF2071 family)